MKRELKEERSAMLVLTKKNEELRNKWNIHECNPEEDKNTSVATQEKPGPHNEVERLKEDRESTVLESTTGAVVGDSDGDIETSTVQDREDQKRSKKEKSIKNKRRKEHEMSSSEESDYSDRSKYNKHRQVDKMKEVEIEVEKKLEEQKRIHLEEMDKLRIEVNQSKEELSKKEKTMSQEVPEEVTLL